MGLGLGEAAAGMEPSARKKARRSEASEASEGWTNEDGSLDHRRYAQQKHDKQRRQVAARVARRGDWFARDVVWINGHTSLIPPGELQDLVLAGGGAVENTREPSVTVCVTETLSRQQRRKLNERKRGRSTPVVTPSWVVDCDAAGRRLATGPYELFRQAPSAAPFAVPVLSEPSKRSAALPEPVHQL